MLTHVHACGGLQTPIDYFRGKDGQSQTSCWWIWSCEVSFNVMGLGLWAGRGMHNANWERGSAEWLGWLMAMPSFRAWCWSNTCSIPLKLWDTYFYTVSPLQLFALEELSTYCFGEKLLCPGAELYYGEF